MSVYDQINRHSDFVKWYHTKCKWYKYFFKSLNFCNPPNSRENYQHKHVCWYLLWLPRNNIMKTNICVCVLILNFYMHYVMLHFFHNKYKGMKTDIPRYSKHTTRVKMDPWPPEKCDNIEAPSMLRNIFYCRLFFGFCCCCCCVGTWWII